MPDGLNGTKKRPTNVSVRADLVARAKELKLNISEVVERALAAAVRERETALWTEENAGAIDAYNARVEARGVFSDDWRRF